ncbi:MAG: holo-[acyl-carrier-protein] synthase [Wolbachia endosymbiont of Fragariocoptes setiger]|nr:holo-[acyl-carrier-protein] synthase [Wolbachia endosymbiont of Fragariocoptes setiger]
MIYGIGTDIIHIPRIFKILQKYRCRFLHRVYSEREIEMGRRYNSYEIQARYFAKRFAVKEAFVKALGTGFNGNIPIKSIEVCNDSKGRPYINEDKDFIPNNTTVHISISDEKEYAIAFVIIQNSLVTKGCFGNL